MENKAYRILIIGYDGIPQHLTRFISVLKKVNPAVEVSLCYDRPISVFPNEISNYICDYIEKKEYRGKIKHIGPLRNLYGYLAMRKQYRDLSRNNNYDIVNIHFVKHYMKYVMKYIKRMSNKIVISPWGSDILRVNDPKVIRNLNKVCESADFITASPTGNIGKVMIEKMSCDSNKMHPLAWGSETIDYLNEHHITTDEAKHRFGLDGRYVITCGYNGFDAQRHEIIIKAINEIRGQLPSNLTLLFPCTYGASERIRKQYVDGLKDLCATLPLDTLFIEDYLSVEELSYLRWATDMFVHIQPTDAGSSSVQEYVLCGKKVVHGAWVSYPHLEQYKPLFYFPVNDLDHFGEVILNAYRSDNIDTPREVLNQISNRGWRAKMELWNEFFISICNN